MPFTCRFTLGTKLRNLPLLIAHVSVMFTVYMGISWLKSTKFQERITQNITEKFNRLKEIFELAEIEILFTNSSG